MMKRRYISPLIKDRSYKTAEEIANVIIDSSKFTEDYFDDAEQED